MGIIFVKNIIYIYNFIDVFNTLFYMITMILLSLLVYMVRRRKLSQGSEKYMPPAGSILAKFLQFVDKKVGV